MSYSGTPIVRQISWLAALPQLAALIIAMTIGYTFHNRDGIIYGEFTYLTYSIGSRLNIPRDHRAGIRLVRQQKFEQAIQKFQASFDFFNRHAWIDRFRSIVLMSPSAASYREMALANIAFCYGQIGNGDQSRLYYQKCLELYPSSGLAISALRMLDSATPKATS